ncbi:hypothetical protein HPB51_004781 [Rhipicephalus microplus]|uniref:Uncharacterized protein n=1 Tax=Rhipicephalus microplus TaxID=6941 RepID=A0A9J6E6R3_RHIMP|nr:hypothetical protein HPB51_004781 [Rhipicephalus microplus]
MSIRMKRVCSKEQQDFETLATSTRRYLGDSQRYDDDGRSCVQIRTRIVQLHFRSWSCTKREVQGVGEIRALYSAFAANEDSEATAKTVAYLVWYSVVLGSRDFYQFYDGTAPSVYRVCGSSLFYISEIQDAFSAAQFTSPEKDVRGPKNLRSPQELRLRGLPAILIDWRRGLGVVQEFHSRTCKFFPTQNRTESAVPIPTATADFGENLLRGRAYGFDVVKRRQLRVAGEQLSRYGHVNFSGDKWLQLSSVAYRYISVDYDERYLPNYAFVGRILAEALWFKLLTHVHWSPSTAAIMERFKRCFVQRPTGRRLAGGALLARRRGPGTGFDAARAQRDRLVRSRGRSRNTRFARAVLLHSRHLLQVSDLLGTESGSIRQRVAAIRRRLLKRIPLPEKRGLGQDWSVHS